MAEIAALEYKTIRPKTPNRMHCNLRPPEPRQSFPALITTPCQVWSCWTYPLLYYSILLLIHDQIWKQSSNPRRSYCNFSVWSWPWTSRYLFRSAQLECHAFNICTKFERNWIIYRWVLDDLAHLRRAILGVGQFCPTVLRGTWTQLQQTWRGHRAIIPTQEIYF